MFIWEKIWDQKFGPKGHPWGPWGPYLWKISTKDFQNIIFLSKLAALSAMAEKLKTIAAWCGPDNFF